MHFLFGFGLVAWLLLQHLEVSAQALRFQPQGATAAGQGNAFVAQADDASAIHYNPAGLSQVEGQGFAIKRDMILVARDNFVPLLQCEFY